MSDSGVARREPCVSAEFVPAEPFVARRPGVIGALGWAVLSSTLHRLRRGECALLAVNLSLIAYHGGDAAVVLVQGLVCTLAILAMYAFNDLYDAPADWNNPKKDRALIATWIEHRRAGMLVVVALKVATVALALATLGPLAAGAVAAVMLVNVAYSTLLKGVPVADIATVWLWGALYAAIVTGSPWLIALVGLMTAVCHLFQALDDRAPDAANGIETTAVCSAALSRNVLIVLSVLLFVALRGPLGAAGALTAFTPLAIFFVVGNPGTGWLLTKAYFAVVWLYLLGMPGAAL